MTKWLTLLFGTLLSSFKSRRKLALENLALRQQLAVYSQTSRRLRLSRADRTFWMLLSSTWCGWRDALQLVQPETVLRWHREGFRKHWTRKSRRPGRPAVAPGVRALIARMREANPLWGAPRVHGELLKLGIDVSEATVSRYMVRPSKPPSQTWRTFLTNHADELLAVDFFTVPTATFRVLFVFVALSHRRREILHTNVIEFPNDAWITRQLIEAAGLDDQFQYLLRDGDAKFGRNFSRQARLLNLKEVVTAPGSPWQNAYVERVIGSIRRECTDHVIVLNERHLRRVVRGYVRYYNEARTHLSLGKDAPLGRLIAFPEAGAVKSRQRCGGLHHEYYREAA